MNPPQELPRGECVSDVLETAIRIWLEHGQEFVQVDHRTRFPVRRVLKHLPHKTAFGNCWIWMGRCNAKGYGYIEQWPRSIYVHRISHAIFHGPLATGIEVLHKCDNPPCWYPGHLFAGTHAANMADMRAKGRGSPPPIHRGESHHNATLSYAQINEMRSLWAKTKHDQRALAFRFGCSQSTVWRVVHHITRNV